MIKDDPRLDENYCIRPLNYENLYSIALDENNRLKGQIEELEEVIEYLEEEIEDLKYKLNYCIGKLSNFAWGEEVIAELELDKE